MIWRRVRKKEKKAISKEAKEKARADGVVVLPPQVVGKVAMTVVVGGKATIGRGDKPAKLFRR